MRMRVISLWQPWASLWLVRDLQGQRVKLHETRDWKPNDEMKGERIGVHASQTMKGINDACRDGDLSTICDDVFGPHWGMELPRGAVIGTITLAAWSSTTSITPAPSEDDFACGNWSEGRYAWLGEQPLLFREPIELKGNRKFFYWDAPDDLKVAA